MTNPWEPSDLNRDWILHDERDFHDERALSFNVDTRDFHVNANDTKPELDLRKVYKNPDMYIHTAEEVVALLSRYYEESGGVGEWRYFSLTGGAAHRTEGWQMKYIRIYRLEGDQLVVTSGYKDDHFVMSKDMLACKVNSNQDILNHY